MPAHHARDLYDVIEIVRHPCCEQLGKRDLAKCGMFSRARKIGRPQVQFGKLSQAVGTQGAKRVEEFCERLPPRSLKLRETIEGRERNVLTVCEQVTNSRDPVGALTLDQMSDDVERAPGIGSLGAGDPGIGKIPQKAVENIGRSAQHGNSGLKIEVQEILLNVPEMSRREPDDEWLEELPVSSVDADKPCAFHQLEHLRNGNRIAA